MNLSPIKAFVGALSLTATNNSAFTANAASSSSRISGLQQHPSLRGAVVTNRSLQNLVPSLPLPGNHTMSILTSPKGNQVSLVLVQEDVSLIKTSLKDISTKLTIDKEQIIGDLQQAGVGNVDSYAQHLDSDGKLWIAARGGDLVSYDTNTGTIETHEGPLDLFIAKGITSVNINGLSHQAAISLSGLKILQDGVSLSDLLSGDQLNCITELEATSTSPALVAIGTMNGGVHLVDVSIPGTPVLSQELSGRAPFDLVKDIKSLNQKIFTVQTNEFAVYSVKNQTYSLEKFIPVTGGKSCVIDKENNRIYLMSAGNLIEVYDPQLNKLGEFEASVEPELGTMGCDDNGNCVLLVAEEDGKAEMFKAIDIDGVITGGSTTPAPTSIATPTPTGIPTVQPTKATLTPTATPTIIKTSAPTKGSSTQQPTATPATPKPSNVVTVLPTAAPTTIAPTLSPTLSPTVAPTTQKPSVQPTAAPTTSAPTQKPTAEPTAAPFTASPTAEAKSSSSPNAGVIAGGTIGGAVGVVGIGMGILILLGRRHPTNP